MQKTYRLVFLQDDTYNLCILQFHVWHGSVWSKFCKFCPSASQLTAGPQFTIFTGWPAGRTDTLPLGFWKSRPAPFCYDITKLQQCWHKICDFVDTAQQMHTVAYTSVECLLVTLLSCYVVLQQEIGWRGRSRKMLLYSTDAGFHYAGDGKVCPEI